MAALDVGSGTVEAVFQRSLYLRAGSRLLCVGDGDLVRGPLNLCLAGPCGWRFPAAACAQGASWSFRQGGLCIGAMPRYRLARPEPWTPGVLPPVTRDASMRGLDALRPCVRELLCERGRPGSGEHIASGELDAGMKALECWLVAELAERSSSDPVPAEVLALLGCGPGLTPSGDDILVGAMVTLTSLGVEDAVRRLGADIQRHMHSRTSRISAAHLQAACRGQAVEPVHAVLWTMVTGDTAGCARAGQRLIGYGQSSGADALAGILLAATVWVQSWRVLPGKPSA